MRIKKTSQTTPTTSQVVNTQSNSSIDSYSCNYVNGLNSVINSVIYENDFENVSCPNEYTDYSLAQLVLPKGKYVIVGQVMDIPWVSNTTMYYLSIKKGQNFLAKQGFYHLYNWSGISSTLSQIIEITETSTINFYAKYYGGGSISSLKLKGTFRAIKIS